MKYINKHIILIGIAALLLGLATVSCTKDNPTREQIRFATEDNWDAASRAAQITTMELFDFKAFAYLKKTSDGTEQLFMNNTVSRKDIHDFWNCERTYYWPGDKYSIRFFAYAPIDAAVTVPQPLQPGQTALTITYTVPTPIEEQKDFMLAMAAGTQADENGYFPGTANATIFYRLAHVLTAVKFKIGEYMELPIKSITIHGINSTADINLANIQGGWSNHSAIQSFTLSSPDETIINEMINNKDKTFMLLPQTLPADAYLNITFLYEGVEKSMIYKIGGTTWNMTDVMVYTLSQNKENNQIVLIVERFTPDNNWSWDTTQGSTGEPEELVPDNSIEW